MRDPAIPLSMRWTDRLKGLAVASLFAATAFGFLHSLALAAEAAVKIPQPAIDVKPDSGLGKAAFAGGCFWGVQAVFQHVKGVTGAVSGYSGGDATTAVYQAVGSGSTGHAEVVEVTFDPAEISYGRLLQVFFSVAHNPTQLNYQGPDHGTQYRSALFPMNGEQEAVAKAYIDQLDATKLFEAKIVTTLEGVQPFYWAEDYHQDFLTLNPTNPYIAYWDLPKLENLKALFPDLYREKPMLVMQAKS